MEFLYLKALHIIFIVTWFAGLFYIVRIFIYLTESADRPEEERKVLVPEYQRNMRRLWLGITWPSAILTLIFGVWTLLLVPHYLQLGFMHIKLFLVLLLYVYHFYCHHLYKKLMNGQYPMSSQGLRYFNEVATLFLVGIVFVIVLKSAMSMIYGLAGLILFTLVLVIAIKIYKKYRNANN
ncbi:MAG: CopD family protein [Candidatus Cyclobacteriaceae bacterium M2_1C_046]